MHNIISNILDKIAELWNRAIKYQTFIILTAIALLVILIFSTPKTNDTAGIAVNMLIFCAAAVGGYLAFKRKGLQLAALTFAAALLLRLCLVFVLENSNPFMQESIRARTTPWIKNYDSVLFEADEFFYVYQGHRYSDTTIGEFINSPEFNEHSYRASFILSRIFRYFGDEAVWARLFGAIMGAFAAAITALAAEKLFSIKTASIVSMISALAPQTAFYSVRFLKENWVIFAVSLMVLGFAMMLQNKKWLTAALLIAAASIFLVWIRVEYGLLFIAAIPIVINFKDNYVKKIAVVAGILVFSTIILVYQSHKLVNKAASMLDKYTIVQRDQRGKIEEIDTIYNIHQTRGPLRFLNIPLSFLNPVPKNLYHFYTAERKLYNTVVLADVYQWWLPFPFLIIGTIVIISRHREFLSILLPYVVVISISAMLLGGLRGDTARYRDSLAPITFIIIGIGVESFTVLPKNWKDKIVISGYAAFAAYAIFVQMFIYLYLKDF
jgi:hypothetical protein